MKKEKPKLKVENPFGAPLPATETLALLAAQARFQMLPPKDAVEGGLELWQAAQQAISRHKGLAEAFQAHYCEPVANTDCPPSYPASFKDFLRLIVGGKDEAEQLRRFRRYLAHDCRMSEARERACELARKELIENGGNPTEEQVKALAADRETKALDSVAVIETTDERVASRLSAYREKSFDESVWQSHAMRFKRWWEAEKTASKSRAGSKGGAARKAERRGQVV